MVGDVVHVEDRHGICPAQRDVHLLLLELVGKQHAKTASRRELGRDVQRGALHGSEGYVHLGRELGDAVEREPAGGGAEAVRRVAGLGGEQGEARVCREAPDGHVQLQGVRGHSAVVDGPQAGRGADRQLREAKGLRQLRRRVQQHLRKQHLLQQAHGAHHPLPQQRSPTSRLREGGRRGPLLHPVDPGALGADAAVLAEDAQTGGDVALEGQALERLGEDVGLVGDRELLFRKVERAIAYIKVV
mmetsp:Transcript_108687/g.317952  ORF Transcript_108687/g.317952 Transcript_108687/m.317952 type:complete len:245 (+) Transcript_108687:354-1088(+)